MITILKGKDITVEWKVVSLDTKQPVDFEGVNARVFLAGPDNTYTLPFEVVREEFRGLSINVSTAGLSTGVYDIKVIWLIDKVMRDYRNVSVKRGVFALTDVGSEVNYDGDSIKIASGVDGFGRDGMSAYEIAVFRGVTDDEVTWVKLKDGDVTTDKLADGAVTTEKLSDEFRSRLSASLDDKVDKVGGKQLSTEDFTTYFKNKLMQLRNYDDTLVKSEIARIEGMVGALIDNNASKAIESFNEIVAFLENVEDTETLEGIIAGIERQIASKQDEIADLEGIREGASRGATSLQDEEGSVHGEHIAAQAVTLDKLAEEVVSPNANLMRCSDLMYDIFSAWEFRTDSGDLGGPNVIENIHGSPVNGLRIVEGYARQDVKMEDGTYTLSFRYCADEPCEDYSANVILSGGTFSDFASNCGDLSISEEVILGGTGALVLTIPCDNEKPRLVSLTFTKKNSIVTSFVFGSTGISWCNICIDSFKLEKGDKITRYIPNEDDVYDAIKQKQDTLISGYNIKTVNGKSLLGNGNMQIDVPDDADLVHKTGNETIGGNKTFTTTAVFQQGLNIKGKTIVADNIDNGELKVLHPNSARGFIARTNWDNQKDIMPLELLATNGFSSYNYLFPENSGTVALAEDVTTAIRVGNALCLTEEYDPRSKKLGIKVSSGIQIYNEGISLKMSSEFTINAMGEYQLELGSGLRYGGKVFDYVLHRVPEIHLGRGLSFDPDTGAINVSTNLNDLRDLIVGSGLSFVDHGVLVPNVRFNSWAQYKTPLYVNSIDKTITIAVGTGWSTDDGRVIFSGNTLGNILGGLVLGTGYSEIGEAIQIIGVYCGTDTNLTVDNNNCIHIRLGSGLKEMMDEKESVIAVNHDDTLKLLDGTKALSVNLGPNLYYDEVNNYIDLSTSIRYALNNLITANKE